MRLGKVKESILKRSVLRQMRTKTAAGSPALGEDAGLLPTSVFGTDCDVAVHINPVEGWTLAAERTVCGAVNSLVAAGASPHAIALSVLMPPETEEQKLKRLMGEISACCEREGLSLLAGHTAVSPYVRTLVLSVNALGSKAREETAHPVRAGLSILAVGTVGREGAAMLAIEREEQLLARYAHSYIETAKSLYADASLAKAAPILKNISPVAVHDVSEGGVFAALWELAQAANTGITVDLKKIPIRQHTIEVCEYFGINPYMLRSGDSLLLFCDNGAEAARLFLEAGFPAAVIGETTDEKARLIRYDKEARFLEPPKMDEYYRVVSAT